jgi:hypothetical protein
MGYLGLDLQEGMSNFRKRKQSFDERDHPGRVSQQCQKETPKRGVPLLPPTRAQVFGLDDLTLPASKEEKREEKRRHSPGIICRVISKEGKGRVVLWRECF